MFFLGGGVGKSWCGKLCFDECRYNLAPIYICEVWSTTGSAEVLLNSRMCGQSQVLPPRDNCALLSPATSNGDCRFSAEVMQAPVRRSLRPNRNDNDMQTKVVVFVVVLLVVLLVVLNYFAAGYDVLRHGPVVCY